MPNWAKVLDEIKRCEAASNPSPVDTIRRKYLRQLHRYTGRNIIAYYSGWLNLGSVLGVDINDMDINGFMTAIHGLDCKKGLDLILHTPGGSISATEHLVGYLIKKFGSDIRAIVPQAAFSAGTMISCACKEVVMGKQSCLGPFDPQINGVSAIRLLEEFEHAIADAKKDPASIPFWQVIIGKYHPTFLDSCELAKNRSEVIVSEWLKNNMFTDRPDAAEHAANVVSKFNEVGHKLDHDKHISLEQCEEIGIKVRRLEEDQELQDLVLTVHHAFMHTLSGARITKAIENHQGIGMFNFREMPR